MCMERSYGNIVRWDIWLSGNPPKVEKSCEEKGKHFLERLDRTIRHLVHDSKRNATYTILCLVSVKTLMRNSPSSPAMYVVGTMQYVPGLSLKRLVISRWLT